MSLYIFLACAGLLVTLMAYRRVFFARKFSCIIFDPDNCQVKKTGISVKKIFLPCVFMFIVLSKTATHAQGLEYVPPQIPGFEPPFTAVSNSPLTDPENAMGLLKNTSTKFRDTAMIDFEGRALTFARVDAEGNVIWTYHFDEFSEYVAASRVRTFHETWYASLNSAARRRVPPPPPRLQWELAMHYPPWAQRLLGNQPPRLLIEGRLQLTAAYERTKIRVGDASPEISRNPLSMETDYEFSITGTVGRLISVNISASRHDGFDFTDDPLRNFKVEYKESEPGELEDEIIQEIVIGYTGFDMPGTSLSGYSDRHEGLFGARMRAKFGPLMLTGIVSQAHGEALSVELGGRNDPNAGAPLRETEFIRNRYFFLHQVYREAYNMGSRPPRVTDFQAFISLDNCHDEAVSTARRYFINDGVPPCFRMLEENREYIIDRDLGVVRFEINVRDENDIAIAMTTTSDTVYAGTIVRIDAADKSVQNLSILKPRGMEELNASDPRFGLMWRNVYHMSDVDAARFEVFYLDPSVGDTIRHIDGRLISNILGLTDEQGRPRVDNVEIFNLANQELILPVWDRGINGNEPFANTGLGDRALTSDSSIYRLGQNTTFMRTGYVPKFGIVTGGSTRRTSYDNLGWNIIPGTVSVRTNGGTNLIEGEDYEIDYQMGVIELLSQRARAAESVIVKYQRESDFVLDRKLFAGLRGEMSLPFISPNSFMAATLLYQNAATTADDIPQLGNEPFSKLHLSFNTSLDFEPEWMTRAVDMLPFINADAPSAAKVDFEIVRSSMNSNTSRGANAYIEDFERTKDAHSLSMRHTLWHPSHFPFAYNRPGGSSAENWSEAISAAMLETGRVPAWQFYWFTPNPHDTDHRINEFSIWRRDEHSARQTTNDFFVDVLRLRATPASRDHPEDVRNRFHNSYASVTASLGRNGLNMENHRYLEMVLNPVGPLNAPPGARRGKLMIQIGTFSHDQVRDGGPPNGRFDLEDTTFQNSPALLEQFDLGLNRLPVEEKFYMIPNSAFPASGWDTISINSNPELLTAPRSRDNPSGDRFRRYDRDNLGNFRMANGTWANSIYDSENIDNDGAPRINITERYYTYEIDLDRIDESPYNDANARVLTENGWRFLRIPLKELLDGMGVSKDSAADGGADWSRVRGVRLVWYDFDERLITSENELIIANLELVGNFWEPRAGSEGKVDPTSISNYEDDAYAASVFGSIVRPKAGERTPEEKSLRLRFSNLQEGDTTLVRRSTVFSPQNLSGYDSVAIMVHPDDNARNGLDFVLRFGSDDSTYYELVAPFTSFGWNRFAISLQDLSDLKMEADHNTPLSEPVNLSHTLPNGTGTIRIHAPGGRRPNFTSVIYMAVGAVRTGGGTLDSAEIWVNEFIATGARRLTGVAGRFDIATQWSDFLSLNLATGYTGGNFRTMTDATFGNDNRSEVFANLTAKMQLEKFLPEEWGVSLPVGGSVSGALSRPTTQPQSDVLLLNDNGNPDGFWDMASDALNLMFGRGRETDEEEASRGQLFETYSSTRTVHAAFERTGRSDNPLINFTLDRIKTDVSYNQTASYTVRGSLSPDYLRTDTTDTYTGNLRYDLSPRNPPSWTTSSPFENLGWMPALYRGYKINLLPSSITLDLAEFQHRVERRNDPRLQVENFETRTFDMRHGLQITYAPIDPLLVLSYSTRVDRDLSDIETGSFDVFRDETLPGIFSLNSHDGEVWDEFGIMHGERRRTQTASLRLSPQVVTWMTHSADYSASYSGAMTTRGEGDDRQYLNAGVGTNLRIRNALAVADLLKKWTVTPPPANRNAADTTDTLVAPRQSFMEQLSGAVNKLSIRSINFDYEVATDLRNSFLTSTFLADTMGLSNFDFFMYQVGLRRSPHDHFTGNVGDDGLGWMRYREMHGVDHELYRFDQSRGAWSARFSSALVIPEPVRINITTVSFGWGREFFSQPDTTFIDTTIVLPEVRVSANTEALMKLDFVKRHMTRLTANTTVSYKLTRKETRERTDTTNALEFQPLISLDGRFVRWPALTSSYRYSLSNTETVTGGKVPLDGEEEPPKGPISTDNSRRSGHTLTLGYEFTNTIRLQEIRIGSWVIPIQGKTNVGITFNRDVQVRRTRRLASDGELGDETEERNTEFNYSPFIDYRFTDNVRGEARYLGTHRNMNGRRETRSRFALSVEVFF